MGRGCSGAAGFRSRGGAGWGLAATKTGSEVPAQETNEIND